MLPFTRASHFGVTLFLTHSHLKHPPQLSKNSPRLQCASWRYVDSTRQSPEECGSLARPNGPTGPTHGFAFAKAENPLSTPGRYWGRLCHSRSWQVICKRTMGDHPIITKAGWGGGGTRRCSCLFGKHLSWRHSALRPCYAKLQTYPCHFHGASCRGYGLLFCTLLAQRNACWLPGTCVQSDLDHEPLNGVCVCALCFIAS